MDNIARWMQRNDSLSVSYSRNASHSDANNFSTNNAALLLIEFRSASYIHQKITTKEPRSDVRGDVGRMAAGRNTYKLYCLSMARRVEMRSCLSARVHAHASYSCVCMNVCAYACVCIIKYLSLGYFDLFGCSTLGFFGGGVCLNEW